MELFGIAVPGEAGGIGGGAIVSGIRRVDDNGEFLGLRDESERELRSGAIVSWGLK